MIVQVMTTRFPNPRKTQDPDGCVALGGDLLPETLLDAYRAGIFPWPISGLSLIPWFCPPERAILEFERLRIPKSLRKFAQKELYRFTRNQAFEAVIEACATVPRGGTWITPEMKQAYIELHQLNIAQSVEVWDPLTQQLIGGLYGVFVEGVFSGESMFYFRPNASKLALLFLIDELKEQDSHWMDIQMMTPHMEALGAHTLTRDAYLDLLETTQAQSRAPLMPSSPSR